MNTEDFFKIFIEELKINSSLRNYYKFLNNPSLFEFRKAYFMQRLNYIFRHISAKEALIFDIGCGYGTTGIFLALNGFKIYGTTLEYYFEQIERRFEFWSKYGNISTFKIVYENLFDAPPMPESFNIIITQDVLHHLEPLQKAINIIHNSLVCDGKLIVCEENGNNILNKIRLFMRRQNKKIVQIYDEKLNKYVSLGNENIRSLNHWYKIFADNNLVINDEDIEFIRFYPPFKYRTSGYDVTIGKEQKIWKKNAFLREYFFHGINFTATKF